jgi:hypothetical protein
MTAGDVSDVALFFLSLNESQMPQSKRASLGLG